MTATTEALPVALPEALPAAAARPSLNRLAIQRHVDSIEWYHDFDFGDGLVARTRRTDWEDRCRLWEGMKAELDRVDFAGKTVLDVGCWDGYWSFYAERRGAAGVLATDDASQNWSGCQGLMLAKDLLGSRVETKLDQSVYDLGSLGRTFDVVLCLGVYYHLLDPFHALAQLRHCCHPGTVVVLEGGVVRGLPEPAAFVDPANRTSKFTPTAGALREMLRATYFRVEREAVGSTPRPVAGPPPGALGWRWRLRMAWQALCGRRAAMKDMIEGVLPPVVPEQRREVWVCRPFAGENAAHVYAPPFGLAAYDARWAAR